MLTPHSFIRGMSQQHGSNFGWTTFLTPSNFVGQRHWDLDLVS